MGVFMYMFLIGIVIGLGIYALTYFFNKSMTNKNRTVIVFASGIFVFLASIIVIGGFAGMPFGVLALGMITIAILFLVFGRKVLWRKIIYTIVILFVISTITYDYLNNVDYWVVKKSEHNTNTYMENLQQNSDVRGYKTVTISEGAKAIILSLGEEMAGNSIEVLDVEEQGYTTHVKIRTFYDQSTEKNPMIMIGLDRLQKEVVITDTDGTVYEEVE
ncbi:hypothetical protein [Lentibacillus sp. Marseille-P4043]|uniref:hypothetical protein n=1 Tax=Lentibacillus sp. Marseille-P4043 TaxID=2040293 RepID=UPI000D0AF725|nr:hypothetical protein [Lentibacillus sp. Marseille-P4043]